MKKIIRNMDTPENKLFWEEAEKSAFEVEAWPDWKRAGINVSQLRQNPRKIEQENNED